MTHVITYAELSTNIYSTIKQGKWEKRAGLSLLKMQVNKQNINIFTLENRNIAVNMGTEALVAD